MSAVFFRKIPRGIALAERESYSTKTESLKFNAYEYLELNVPRTQASFYLDSYENFGWVQDENLPVKELGGNTTLQLKRDRKIANKAELTRLQRNFEACMTELESLERSKTVTATAAALAAGMAGTAFMAGSVFAIVAPQPHIVLCIILAILAFAGWIAPYFLYRKLKAKKTKDVTPYIEKKYDEIYAICEKGHNLL